MSFTFYGFIWTYKDIHPTIIAYGLYLYFSSISYRFASKSLEQITKRTHVSIWKWVQKYAKLIDRFVVIGRRRRIKEIFVDETLLKVDGQNYWLWLASLWWTKSTCLFAISSVSWEERTIFVCYQFFRQIRRTRFGNKPIFTDSAHWYIMMHADGS